MSDSQATGPEPTAGRARRRPTLDGSWRPASAGALAAGVAIAASELVAGLAPGAPSLVTAMGSLVISLQPPGAKDLVANLFGTNDKVALSIAVLVVALSASAFAEDSQRALAAGMNDFAPKPIELTGLRAVLKKWLPAYDAPETHKAAASGV